MATQQFKLTFWDNAEAGWEELCYGRYANLVLARDILPSFVNQRASVLSDSFRIVHAVVSDVKVFNDSYSWPGPPVKGGIVDEAQPSGLAAYNRLLCRVEAGAAHRRRLELGGIPSGVIGSNGVYYPNVNPSFTRNLKKYIDYLLGGSGTYIRLKGAINSPPTKYPITAATISLLNPASVSVTVATDLTATFPKGTFVRISQAKFTHNFNGLWTVDVSIAVGATTQITLRPRRYPVMFTTAGYSTYGNITVIHGVDDTDFEQMTNIYPERGVLRKTGRPIDVLHGRQSHQN